MTDLLSAAQMRDIEAAAIESGEATGLGMMERAGRGVVAAVSGHWLELDAAPGRAAVLCGPGNNGGDGFVVARLLVARGWAVEVFLLGDPERLPPDARINHDRWRADGEVASLADYVPGQGGHDLCVDALFGTGLARSPEGEAARVLAGLAAVPAGRERLVCVDILSGLCADSGRVLGGVALPRAALTVSFHRAKRGHYLDAGAGLSGRLAVADIGLSPEVEPRESGAPLRLVSRPRPAGALLRSGPAPDGGAHKYSHGHALVLTGGAGRTGAARLAARGALRIGAGLVTLGVPGSAQMEVACQIKALMLRRVDDATGLAGVLEDQRLKALCLGPGLGVERARELVPVSVHAKHRPALVLDADALTAYAGDPEELFGMLHEDCVLTPHDGEFAKLFPDIAEKLNASPAKGPAFSKVDAAREAAARAGSAVLLKGPDTVIAAPDGTCAINSAQYDRTVPWLATAGAGDVLAGFITGLLARGFAPVRAAEMAAWLHVESARRFGPGLVAEDLPEELPAVLRALRDQEAPAASAAEGVTAISCPPA